MTTNGNIRPPARLASVSQVGAISGPNPLGFVGLFGASFQDALRAPNGVSGLSYYDTASYRDTWLFWGFGSYALVDEPVVGTLAYGGNARVSMLGPERIPDVLALVPDALDAIADFCDFSHQAGQRVGLYISPPPVLLPPYPYTPAPEEATRVQNMADALAALELDYLGLDVGGVIDYSSPNWYQVLADRFQLKVGLGSVFMEPNERRFPSVAPVFNGEYSNVSTPNFYQLALNDDAYYSSTRPTPCVQWHVVFTGSENAITREQLWLGNTALVNAQAVVEINDLIVP